VSPASERERVQAAIVRRLLDQRHVPAWNLEDLWSHIQWASGPAEIHHALGELVNIGAVVRDGEHYFASPVTRKLDALGLVATDEGSP
jgi:hypothetical protein